MRFAWSGLAVLLVASLAPARADQAADPAQPPDDPWAAVEVVKLHEAVADGRVVASGHEPRSYTGVKLRLRNPTKTRVAVDVAGSYLAPKRRGSCQRLGLGPAVTPSATLRRGPGTAVVQLEPGEQREIDMNTCCLDAGLPGPGRQEFDAMADALPEVREGVLRWWADNPTAPQSAVNCAIWSNSPTVHLSPGVVENYVRPKGRFPAVHRGVYYRLRDGELTSTDSLGIVRILGTEVFQVLPADDGVYAVALGDDRKPKLWRIPVTAEEHWTRVADLDGTSRVRDVIAAGRGNLVLVTDRGIDWFDKARDAVTSLLRNEQFVHISVRRPSDDRLTVTLRRPPREPIRQGGQERLQAAPAFEVWTVALATGEIGRADEFWNVGMMLAGTGGVFALSHTEGRLRRLAGERFSDLGPDASYRRILAVAGELVWLADSDDRVVAVDARTGRPRFRTEVVAGERFVFDADPATGDLAYVTNDEFRWLHAADGREELLPDR